MRSLCMLAVAALACLSSPLPAQEAPRSAAVRAEIRDFLAGRNVPGMAVGIVEGSRLRVLEGFGTADLEWGSPATAETVFELGSVTKPFTAMAVLRLRREGLLRLSDTLGELLDDIPPAWAEITVEQLLGHTAGISNFTDGDDVEMFRTAWDASDVIARVADRPLDFPPGTRHRYSNTNYYVLGLVIEAVTGGTYWEYLDRTFFRPLGMTHTGPTRPEAVVPWRAEGYRWVDEAHRNVDVVRPSTVFAAGGLHSTAVDLVAWLQALGDDAVLTADEKEEMWSPGERADGTLFGYGLGWSVQDLFGHRAVYHIGATAAFETAVVYFPEERVGVVVLANRYRANVISLAWTLAGHYVEGILPAQLEPRPELDTPERQPVREALRALGEREMDHPRISEAFAEGLRGDFAFFLNGLDDVVEEGTALELLWVQDVSDHRFVRFGQRVAEVAYYRARTGDSVRHLHVHLTADGRIADIDLSR